MLKDAHLMFQDMDAILRGLKKKTYEKNMEIYRDKYGYFFDEMINTVASADDKEAAAGELAGSICEQVLATYNKRGRIPKKLLMNINFVLIYYIFPAILMTGSEDATLIADTLRDKWNAFFGCTINYTTYDVIYDGFQNRIFGFVVG